MRKLISSINITLDGFCDHTAIDEYQFHLQPIILGRGLPLFKNIRDKVDLRLVEAKPHGSGVVTLRYERNQ